MKQDNKILQQNPNKTEQQQQNIESNLFRHSFVIE